MDFLEKMIQIACRSPRPNESKMNAFVDSQISVEKPHDFSVNDKSPPTPPNIVAENGNPPEVPILSNFPALDLSELSGKSRHPPQPSNQTHGTSLLPVEGPNI